MGSICFPSVLDFPGTGKLRKEVAKRKEKSKTERPYTPCLGDEAWLLGQEDAAGLTRDPGLSYLVSPAELDDAKPTSVSSPGNAVILSAGIALPALRHVESCAPMLGDWEWCAWEVLEGSPGNGNVKGRGGRRPGTT